MLTLFLVAVFFCVYTYLLFPLWLAFRARSRPEQVALIEREEWPTVTILIAAHNEESTLPGKLDSLELLDYPVEQLQILVISDGSTDNTVDLVKARSYTCHHYEPARGKPTALNEGLALATGEYIIYTDARQALSRGTVKALIAGFDDPTVGAVSGELVMASGNNNDAVNVGLYWRYEKWIRQNESRIFSTTGATGALYAIKRSNATKLPADALLDDFEIPVQILKNGLRTILESRAIAYDSAEDDSGREYQRKVRTLSGNFQSFANNIWLFNPNKNPVWWQFLSHKVFRLLVPFALMIAFVASVLGSGWFLNLALVVQLLFYGSGLLSLFVPGVSANRVLNFIKVFLQMNAAAVSGAVRFFSGRSTVRWKGDA